MRPKFAASKSFPSETQPAAALFARNRVAGDWTTAFAKALGCDLDSSPKASHSGGSPRDDKKTKRQTTIAGPAKEGKLGGGEGELVELPLHKNLPRIMVDG